MSHVTRTPLSRSKGQRSRSPGCFTHHGVNASGSCSGERGNVLAVGTYCYVVVCRRGGFGSARRFDAHRCSRGAGHIVAADCLQLVTVYYNSLIHRQQISGSLLGRGMVVDDDDVIVTNAAQTMEYLSERRDNHILRCNAAFKTLTITEHRK